MTVFYKEDVAEMLRCTPTTALLLMQRTGKTFKIGKRIAISSEDFPNLFNSGRRVAETPEGIRTY